MLAFQVDKSQVPPLHQKRIVEFVNHFLVSSCNFLNQFATNCESKFIELERKIQRLEAGLTIIEAKLASIPADTFTTKESETKKELEKPEDSTAEKNASTEETDAPTPPAESVVHACEDVRYKKFFKMVQFGVQPEAVKLKMEAEGFDPSILDKPNLALPDGVRS